VLGHCTALTDLNLSNNQIGSAGAESLAGVLWLCPALANLNLTNNGIGPVEAHRIRWSLPKVLLMKLKV